MRKVARFLLRNFSYRFSFADMKAVCQILVISMPEATHAHADVSKSDHRCDCLNCIQGRAEESILRTSWSQAVSKICFPSEAKQSLYNVSVICDVWVRIRRRESTGQVYLMAMMMLTFEPCFFYDPKTMTITHYSSQRHLLKTTCFGHHVPWNFWPRRTWVSLPSWLNSRRSSPGR